jgi:transposase
MSRRELRRVGVMARVKSGELKLVDAASLLNRSYRQVKRVWGRYQTEGAKGLKHRSAGRESNRKKPKKFREKVLRTVRKKYSGEVGERFGPTLAAEHLESEDQLAIHPETLRRWMLEEGLWSRSRKRRAHRQRRARKEHFGELVQMDGSFHEWFEKRGPEACLMNLVDDATGTTLARLGEQETIWAAARVLRQWIETHGVPLALYTDWKNVYVREPNAKELLHGIIPVTQFGRMCERLGIQIIAASSPQAKGRVERNHGTHQDRLVKKLRRKKMQSCEAANEYLEREYLEEHNHRFAQAAVSSVDYHRKAPCRRDMEDVFRLETERVIGNDWVVRYQNRLLQVQKVGRHYAPAQSKVMVCEWEDGRMEIRYRGQVVAWQEILEPPRRAVPEAKPVHSLHAPNRPKADHPWRKPFRNARSRQEAGISMSLAGDSASASP